MEDKDIEILKKELIFFKENQDVLPEELKKFYLALEKLLQAYKQDEKVIEEMAKALKSYANLGILIKCPARTNNLCNKCIIDYFRKRCEKNNDSKTE